MPNIKRKIRKILVSKARRYSKKQTPAKRILHPSVRSDLGVPRTMDDKTFLKRWRVVSRKVCKPCWELRYCPYGPLVEDFPLLSPRLDDVVKHNKYLQECIDSGKLGNGEPLDETKRHHFKKEIASFNPKNYPVSIPIDIIMMSCSVFGHICPVVFVNEAFTETSEKRRSGRYIPFKTKIRVVRRDNFTCQHCGKHLLDNEVEFDHRIPISRGGSTDEHNLRLTCHDCNHDKSDRIDI